jgi:hypothetical protein
LQDFDLSEEAFPILYLRPGDDFHSAGLACSDMGDGFDFTVGAFSKRLNAHIISNRDEITLLPKL